jgi:hypothetical protein
LGVAAVIAHEAYDIYVGHLDASVDPFVHILTEFAVFGSSGAVILAVAAALHNRARRRQSRGADAD